MTDHVHEWRWTTSFRYRCFECDAVLNPYDGQDMLNAAQQLSAEDAASLVTMFEWMADALIRLDPTDGRVGSWNWSKLHAYAKARGGE